MGLQGKLFLYEADRSFWDMIDDMLRRIRREPWESIL
jgi:hypothetical protein